MAPTPEDPEARFLRKFRVDEETGCWMWTAATNGVYGKFWPGYPPFGSGRLVSAHRWAFGHWVRPLESGEQACHRCDTPLCVNPEHLFAAPYLLNVRDKVAKGRHHNQRKETCPRGHPYDTIVHRREGLRRRCNQCRREDYRARSSLR